MSEGFENTEEVLAEDQFGQTSVEAAATEAMATEAPKRSGLNVFDVMLLISAICVTLATGLMFLELFQFGDLSGFPWRTAEFQVK